MISSKQLEKLKILFREDGIELSDAASLEVAQLLVARANVIATIIPSDKAKVFNGIINTQVSNIKQTVK